MKIRLFCFLTQPTTGVAHAVVFIGGFDEFGGGRGAVQARNRGN
jgi:hypothetical protein